MLKKKPLSIFFTLILLLSILWLAQQQQISENVQFSNSCELNSNSCEVQINGDSIQIKVSQFPIPLEEELRFILTLPPQFEWVEGYITGSNMYMGKIPMLLEQSPAPIQVVTFLGSCSEPNMRWMAQITLKNTQSNQHETLYIRFQTHI